MEKKMHIDGIKEIENIDGYEIQFNKTNDSKKIQHIIIDKLDYYNQNE